MTRLKTLLGGVTGLAIAGAAALLIFVLLGGLLIVAGVVIAVLLVAGGVYTLMTGKPPFSVRTATVEDIGIFRADPRRPGEGDMIDVTPPKDRRS